LLQTVAQRLKRRLKGVEMIARVGGDEFEVVQSAEKPPSAAVPEMLARFKTTPERGARRAG
jgi:GGDEF domain-containing protein